MLSSEVCRGSSLLLFQDTLVIVIDIEIYLEAPEHKTARGLTSGAVTSLQEWSAAQPQPDSDLKEQTLWCPRASSKSCSELA